MRTREALPVVSVFADALPGTCAKGVAPKCNRRMRHCVLTPVSEVLRRPGFHCTADPSLRSTSDSAFAHLCCMQFVGSVLADALSGISRTSTGSYDRDARATLGV